MTMTNYNRITVTHIPGPPPSWLSDQIRNILTNERRGLWVCNQRGELVQILPFQVEVTRPKHSGNIPDEIKSVRWIQHNVMAPGGTESSLLDVADAARVLISGGFRFAEIEIRFKEVEP